MRSSLVRWGFVVGVAAVSAIWSGHAGAQTTETYLFRDSFEPNEGAGNVLVPVSNATGTIVTDGPSFLNGAFVTETISAEACASTPSVRAWSFPTTAGLRYPNAAPALVTGSYTISMLMRFDPMDAEYARLIDFSNSTLDTGIYKLDDGVSFYPVGEFAAGSFVSGRDVFVTITRDATSKLVSLFINGAPAGTYTDTLDRYAPSASVLYFLMDNTTGSAAIDETDAGIIAYLQVRNAPITAEEVTASLASICTTVTCGEALGTPTYPSISCRLDDLIARAAAETGFGKLKNRLTKSLGKARSHLDAMLTLCGQQNTKAIKKAKKRVQQAGKALSSFAHTLGSRTARKAIEDMLRQSYQTTGQTLADDAKTYRASFQCPAI